jgi:hypothetical protein
LALRKDLSFKERVLKWFCAVLFGAKQAPRFTVGGGFKISVWILKVESLRQSFSGIKKL